MKKLLLVALLLSLIATALPLLRGGQQAPPSTYVPQLISFPGAPTGVCDIYQIALNNSNGRYYSCTPGTRTWTAVSPLTAPATYNPTTGVLNLGIGNLYSGVIGLGADNGNTLSLGAVPGSTSYTIHFPGAAPVNQGQVMSFSGSQSPLDPDLVWSYQVQVAVVAVAGLPACNGATEGMERAVTDSNTATWGATVAAGAANHILAYCDGTLWTVAGK